MSQILITEKQLIKLIETGSNSVAMDLELYTSVNPVVSDNGNLDTEETMQEIINKVQELLSMVKAGYKVKPETKHNIARALDFIDISHSKIKFDE